MEEIWMDIPEYEGYYQVSNLGRFKGLERVIKYNLRPNHIVPEKLLKPEITKDNYRRVVLVKDGVKKRYMCHRLVAIAFISNPLNKPFINHIDGNKGNNIVSNLEWCTESENMIHADITGLRNMFEHHHPSNSKKIKCIETGEIFPSYYRAVRWLNKTSTSISSLVRGVRASGKAFGYHWEFIN